MHTWGYGRAAEAGITSIRRVHIFPEYLPFLFSFLFLAQQPPVGQGLLIHKVCRSHSLKHHCLQDSSGRVISSSQRPLYLTSHNTRNRQTSMPPLGFEPTISRRAAVGLRLRPSGHWDQLTEYLGIWEVITF